MSDQMAPDLRHGFIENGGNGGNAWVTEIQSVLTEHGGEGDERLYLSHECRKEAVPFMGAPDGPGEGGIFMPQSPHEYLTFTRGDRFFQIPSSDTVLGMDAMRNITRHAVGDRLFAAPYTQSDWVSRVHCPDTPIRILDFDAVHGALIRGALDIRNTFLRFDWRREDGQDCTVHAPCRYLNFSPADAAGTPYLQPISGYILFPMDSIHVHGYLACAVDSGGRTTCEVAVPRFVDIYELIGRISGNREELAPLLGNLSKLIPGFGRRFDTIIPLAGTLTLYRYASP